MMNKVKNSKGITLIALVITIIVLLILAAVTISIVQNGGIISNAQKAKEEYTAAQEKECNEIQNFSGYPNNDNEETNPDDSEGSNTEDSEENDGINEEQEVKITVTSDVDYFIAGNTMQLNVTTNPNVDINQLTFESSDETIATVNNSGVVTGISFGYTTITVSYEEYSTEYFLKVEEDVSTLIISPDEMEIGDLAIGDTVQLVVTTEPTTVPKGTFTYESYDETVATVDSNGLVTVLSEGYIDITVTYTPPRGAEGPQCMERWSASVMEDPF